MPEEQVLPAGHFEKVGSNYIYYDTVCIGPRWKERSRNWFDSLTEMSNVDKITFFNTRTGSRDGYAYTNMDTIDQIGRPYKCESFGMSWIYPDPIVGGQHDLDVNAAKFFTSVLPLHCYIEFWIRDDQWFVLRPHHAPSGYGPAGDIETSAAAPAASTLITNGVPHSLNRWRWTENGIKIPETAQIKLVLTFSDYGKALLREMDQVLSIDSRNEEPFGNCAMIEVNIRGKRYSQMKGKYYK